MLNNSFDKTHTSAIKLKKEKATFADNVLTLAGGTTIALGVTILASPITSRLFAPEAFGLAALFMSGATVAGLLACMRYEMAIVLPKNDEEAASLFHFPGSAVTRTCLKIDYYLSTMILNKKISYTCF